MITRQHHMDGYGKLDKAGRHQAHRDYYAQFVTESVKNTLLHSIGRSSILNSSDHHFFNDIPLRRWDTLPIFATTDRAMRKAGDYPTLSGKVCIYKEAARQIHLDYFATKQDGVS